MRCEVDEGWCSDGICVCALVRRLYIKSSAICIEDVRKTKAQKFPLFRGLRNRI
jgi:hypothetical protein